MAITIIRPPKDMAMFKLQYYNSLLKGDFLEEKVELCNNSSRALPGTDSNNLIDIENTVLPSYNIFNRYYYNLRNIIVPKRFGERRSYEVSTYYLVLTPLNKRYLENPDSFQYDIKKIEKDLRRSYPYERVVITREILDVSKTHYNILITTKGDPFAFHQKVFKNRYGMFVQDASTHEDITKIISYMFKESKRREFIDNKDYFIYRK